MNMAIAQVSVAATAGGTLLAAERAGRAKVTLVNHSTADVFIGPSGVTTSTGALLAGVKGQTLTVELDAAIYGIVATSTETVSVIEIF